MSTPALTRVLEKPADPAFPVLHPAMLPTFVDNPSEWRAMCSMLGAARLGAGTLFTLDLSEGALQPGRFVVTRLLLIVAITVAYVDRSYDRQLAWLGAGVLLLLTAAEPLLRRLGPRVEALQLPGLRIPPGASFGRVLAVVAPVLLVLFAAFALWGVDPRGFLVLAAVQLAPSVCSGPVRSATPTSPRGLGAGGRSGASAVSRTAAHG